MFLTYTFTALPTVFIIKDFIYFFPKAAVLAIHFKTFLLRIFFHIFNLYDLFYKAGCTKMPWTQKLLKEPIIIQVIIAFLFAPKHNIKNTFVFFAWAIKRKFFRFPIYVYHCFDSFQLLETAITLFCLLAQN